MTERATGYRPGLIDTKTGQISREIFVNEAIYAEEQERIFARAWLFIGHESQIPNPGDYAAARMGEEAVILCRDRAGEVHVFLNSCRHPRMKVCRYDEGNTAVLTCPYHGWSYGTDGRLVGVPFFREAYHSSLDRAQWVWSKSRNSPATRERSGPPGIQRRHPSSNISAISAAIST